MLVMKNMIAKGPTEGKHGVLFVEQTQAGFNTVSHLEHVVWD